MQRQRVRIRFRKEGDLRLISHRDLLVVVERLFRRVGLTLSMSGRFHPRPRISFPLSLALGIRGVDEMFEAEFDDPPEAPQLKHDLQRAAPDGLIFSAVEFVAPHSPKLAVSAACYEIDLPPGESAGVADRIAAFLAAPSHVIVREHGERTIDVRAAVEALTMENSRIHMRLRTSSTTAVAKPQEVLAAIGLGQLLDRGCFLTRTELTLAQSAACGS
jgi:radical SAM-linked protein